MNTLRKLFGEQKMGWGKVIVFAVIAGVYTGLINQVPALENTSFRDIAISFEVWILFALLIVTNCKAPLEAGLKCGVFFLISQPLVYLVEMPGLGYFPWEYYRYWFILTLFTFPGGALAWFVKKRNMAGTLVLSLANALLIAIGVSYVKEMLGDFPHHLLSAVYCFVIAVLFVMILQPGKKERILGFTVIAAIFAAAVVFLFGLLPGVGGTNSTYEMALPEESKWTCVLEDPTMGEAVVTGDAQVTITLHKQGATKLVCTDAEGNQVSYDVSVGAGNVISCVPES